MGDVAVLPDDMPHYDIKADILLVLDHTCEQSLLAGTSVQFVGTATARVDHFDIEAIERLGGLERRTGSNAVSVVEYVYALWRLRAGSAGMTGCPVGLVGWGRSASDFAPQQIWAVRYFMIHCSRLADGLRRVELGKSYASRHLSANLPTAVLTLPAGC